MASSARNNEGSFTPGLPRCARHDESVTFTVNQTRHEILNSSLRDPLGAKQSRPLLASSLDCHATLAMTTKKLCHMITHTILDRLSLNDSKITLVLQPLSPIT